MGLEGLATKAKQANKDELKAFFLGGGGGPWGVVGLCGMLA